MSQINRFEQECIDLKDYILGVHVGGFNQVVR